MCGSQKTEFLTQKTKYEKTGIGESSKNSKAIGTEASKNELGLDQSLNFWFVCAYVKPMGFQ